MINNYIPNQKKKKEKRKYFHLLKSNQDLEAIFLTISYYLSELKFITSYTTSKKTPDWNNDGIREEQIDRHVYRKAEIGLVVLLNIGVGVIYSL